MALDLLCLLDHLQWTEERSLHVVGISLGGMIAQGIHPYPLRQATHIPFRTCFPNPQPYHVPQSGRDTRRWMCLGQHALSMCAYSMP